MPPTYRPRGADIPGHRDISSPNEIRPIVLNDSEARPSSLDSMQGRPLRGAPVLILSDLICDTFHIRHLSVSEPLSNISKVYISPMFTSCAGFFFRLDILLIRAPTVFQKILAQPNQAKKETKPGNFPAFRHGPPALCVGPGSDMH